MIHRLPLQIPEVLAQKLCKLHIHTSQDLLFYLPYRYEDRTRITPIKDLKVGQKALVEGQVLTQTFKKNRPQILTCYLQDSTGVLKLNFFHYIPYQSERLAPGLRVRCFGEVQSFSGFTMVHPECVILKTPLAIDTTLMPIYHLTSGLSQNTLRSLMRNALQVLHTLPETIDYLPHEIREYYDFPNFKEALFYLHFPPPACALVLPEETFAHRRLAFEELLAHHLSMRTLKHQNQKKQGYKLQKKQELQSKLRMHLPFALTEDQEKVLSEINNDLQSRSPMQRLVQGDVGSGKTIVAFMAALRVIESGLQVALMVPTELLAQQHYHQFKIWCELLGLDVRLLLASHKGTERKTILSKIKDNTCPLIVGTHALFQDPIEFHKLALVIIDEQHRFGVSQRLKLVLKGASDALFPHQLSLSATPIPRTLAMNFYADLDISTIKHLPPGRSPIITAIIESTRRNEVIARLTSLFKQKKQAYWVCTLIETSEKLQSQAAQKIEELLKKELPDARIALLHGRLKSDRKEKIMRAFKDGDIDLLVATTVIEVGVDVPNASIMIIENPERLGLSQLHQLRGRVGRGTEQSYCLLLYQTPLSEIAYERLDIFRKTQDGFILAEKDLELRGPGEILGIRQTGNMQFKVADFKRDRNLLYDLPKMVDLFYTKYPEKIPLIIERWIGEKRQYVYS